MLPKELAAATIAYIAAIAIMRCRAHEGISSLSLLVLIALFWLTISVAFAQNQWAAVRAWTQLAGTLVVFLAAAGAVGAQRKMLLRVAIAAGVLVSLSMLLESYSSLRLAPTVIGRAPGGLLGNRNLASRFLAISVCVASVASTSRRPITGRACLAVAIGLMAWALTLARTRAAWLGISCGIIAFLLSVVWIVGWEECWSARGRLALPGVAAVVGVLMAVIIPNHLTWSSANPMHDTLVRVIDWQDGSGAGRLRQYGQTFRMIRANPVTGVGLGNWSVQYPRFLRVEERESQLYRFRPRDRMATSDLLTLTAECGFPFIIVGLAIVFLAIGRLPPRKKPAITDQLRWSTCVAVVAAVSVMLMIDNVILVQPTACLAAAVLGSLSAVQRPLVGFTLSHWLRRGGLAITVCVGAMLVARLATQNAVALVFASGTSSERLQRLSQLDPGEYWLYTTLSFEWKDRGRCDLARVNARKAAQLYPWVFEPRVAQAVCVREPARHESH